MIKVTLPIETPVIHVPLSGRVGGTLSHKSYSSLSWEDQTANGHLHGQSPRSGFAVIGPFEPMPSGTGIAPPRCHPPPDGGTLRHVNNSLPGPVSEGSVHGNGSRQPDNWLSALADPFVTVLAHGNGVYELNLLSNHSKLYLHNIIISKFSRSFRGNEWSRNQAQTTRKGRGRRVSLCRHIKILIMLATR